MGDASHLLLHLQISTPEFTNFVYLSTLLNLHGVPPMFQVLGGKATPFRGTGWWRPLTVEWAAVAVSLTESHFSNSRNQKMDDVIMSQVHGSSAGYCGKERSFVTAVPGFSPGLTSTSNVTLDKAQGLWHASLSVSCWWLLSTSQDERRWLCGWESTSSAAKWRQCQGLFI